MGSPGLELVAQRGSTAGLAAEGVTALQRRKPDTAAMPVTAIASVCGLLRMGADTSRLALMKTTAGSASGAAGRFFSWASRMWTMTHGGGPTGQARSSRDDPGPLFCGRARSRGQSLYSLVLDCPTGGVVELWRGQPRARHLPMLARVDPDVSRALAE